MLGLNFVSHWGTHNVWHIIYRDPIYTTLVIKSEFLGPWCCYEDWAPTIYTRTLVISPYSSFGLHEKVILSELCPVGPDEG